MTIRPESMVAAMAPTAKLSTTSVIDEAVNIVDQRGYDALTVSAVATELNVAPSALYTYCDGLDGLRNLVAIAATENLTRDVRDAATGAAGETALNAMAEAYRDFSLLNSGQFAATLRPPKRDNKDLADADSALLAVFVLVYGGMGLDPRASQRAARSTRSAIHGFLALEHVTGTSPLHSDEYHHLLATLHHGLDHDS